MKKGFTLIELVMIIVILGILAAVAIPRYYDLAEEAHRAAEAGVIGAVRGGIHTFFARNRTWPASLDNAVDGAASDINQFFDTVLEQGIIVDWSKSGTIYTYTGDPAGGSYTYSGATGTFQ